jgi:hypothetical protein
MFILVLSVVNLDENVIFDAESPEASRCRELSQVILALSHACQMINALAFLFQVHLPFHLHHR